MLIIDAILDKLDNYADTIFNSKEPIAEIKIRKVNCVKLQPLNNSFHSFLSIKQLREFKLKLKL